MKNLLVKSFLILSFSFLLLNCKEEIVIENTNDFEAFLQDEMEIQNIPALSVLAFRKGDILYEKNLGKSQIEQNKPLESDHLFLLASISKVITATALLQLQEKGHFELDDKINNFLSFKVEVPGYNTDITFRMLLTHTSGIADGSSMDDQYYFGEDSPVTLRSYLENYLKPSGSYYDANDNFHNFEPGTQYEYSNMGNALIGLLVEEISGKDFNEYCKQNIFQPLGMNHTAWRLDEINQTIVQPYRFENGQYQAIQHYTFTDYPNGGLRSTARDLFKFLSAFAQGGSFNSYQLLKETTITEMIKPQIPSIDNTMGLHIFKLNIANNLWGHDGGEEGVSTIMAFNPNTKVGAIILSNQGDADLDQVLVETYKMGIEL